MKALSSYLNSKTLNGSFFLFVFCQKVGLVLLYTIILPFVKGQKNTLVYLYNSLQSNSHHPYMTTGKTIALTRQNFVGKVMSLLFNMLSRLVITSLPRSKRLLISQLQSLSAVILEPKKISFVTASTFPPSIYQEVMGPDAMILVF